MVRLFIWLMCPDMTPEYAKNPAFAGHIPTHTYVSMWVRYPGDIYFGTSINDDRLNKGCNKVVVGTCLCHTCLSTTSQFAPCAGSCFGTLRFIWIKKVDGVLMTMLLMADNSQVWVDVVIEVT